MSPVARATDPETSHEAAASITGLRETQLDVLKVFRVWGPMTDEQLVGRMTAVTRRGGKRQQSPSGIRTRRFELVSQGVIKDSGRRAMMTTGRRAIVWELVP